MSFLADHWNKIQRYAGPIICLILVIIVGASGSSYWIYIASLVGTYAIVVLGLNVTVAYVGQFNFAQAAFMAVGGYGVAILTVKHHWNPWLALVVSLAAAGLAAIVIGLPLFRLRGHYLAMATFALAFGVDSYANAAGVTGGAVGMFGVPSLSIGGITFGNSQLSTLILIAVLYVVAAAGVVKLRGSRVGREWSTVAKREDVASSLGIDVRRQKLVAFAAAGVLAALGGALYVTMTNFVSSDQFGATTVVNLFVMLFIAGRGRTLAPLVGAAIVVIVPEELSSLSNIQGIVFDAALLIIIVGLPQGLLGWVAERASKFRPGGAVAADAAPVATSTGSGALVLPSWAAAADRDKNAELRGAGVSKRFGGVQALDDVNISIRPARVTGLIGPNGAGKSTLLSILSGAVSPDAGSVKLGQADLTGAGRQRGARAGVVQTFQAASPVAGLTALENVLVGASLHNKGGWPSVLASTPRVRRQESESRERAAAMLESLGIGAVSGRDAASLSFGQLRLLEIARSVMVGASILLLDEPAAGLNRIELVQVSEAIKKMSEQGIGFLVVDHDVSFLFDLCDHIVAMDFGKVIAEGTPMEIEQDRRVQLAYLGTEQTESVTK